MIPPQLFETVRICISKGYRPTVGWDGMGPTVIWSPPMSPRMAAILARIPAEALADAAFEKEIAEEAERREGRR